MYSAILTVFVMLTIFGWLSYDNIMLIVGMVGTIYMVRRNFVRQAPVVPEYKPQALPPHLLKVITDPETARLAERIKRMRAEQRVNKARMLQRELLRRTDPQRFPRDNQGYFLDAEGIDFRLDD